MMQQHTIMSYQARRYIFYVWLACCFIWSLSACQTTPTQATPTQATNDKKLHHIVMVWFNDQVDDSEKKAIQQATKALQEIPEMLSLEVGTAIPSERRIVDDSFDLGVIMTFRNPAAMQAYLEHPKHKAFLKQYIQGKTKKIVVYDF